MALERGWASVDVKLRDKSFRFITTHLEGSTPPEAAAIQIAQGLELLAGPAAGDLPVVLVGDFNSRADRRGTPTYGTLTSAGFDDAWLHAGPSEVGLTCCFAPSLRDPADTLDRRIDLILTRGGFRVARTDVVGEEPADMVGGLWPSDHAGVVATLNLPGFSISDATVTEGDSGTRNITFTVRRAGDRSGPASVGFRTRGGTAQAGADYHARSGTLSFAPGQRTRTVTVAVRGDTAPEPDETFTLLLRNPSGAAIADARGRGTIRDDDGCTITGTRGNDVLRGTPGDDVICPSAGNDTVYGRGGNDVIRSDSGNDVLRGGEGNDRLTGGPGRDILYGNGGADALNALDGTRRNDVAKGGQGSDSCTADRGDVVQSC